MPELPEVETYRLYLEGTSLHQPLAGFDAERPKLLAVPLETLQEQLRGNQFIGTHRIGKHLLVQLERGPWLVLHFGMTGDLAYFRDAEDRPPLTRALFHFRNGNHLAFIDSRIFGKIGLTPDVETYRKEKKLGPDALEITTAQLQEALRKRSSAIKPVLLDQQVLAGIGNWIADEVLYQARLHPLRPAKSLSAGEVNRLQGSIQDVLETAIRHEALYRHFPAHYLIHTRAWDEVPEPGTDRHLHCSRCQSLIVKTTVGGRATYLCPECQPQVV